MKLLTSLFVALAVPCVSFAQEEAMAKEALNKAVADLVSLDVSIKGLTTNLVGVSATTDALYAQWVKDFKGTCKAAELPAIVAIALAESREIDADKGIAYAKTRQAIAEEALKNAFKNAEAGLWKSVLENSATASTACVAGKVLGTDPASAAILEAISANITASGLMNPFFPPLP